MNRFADAEGVLRGAQNLNPKDPIVLTRIGDSLARRGRNDEARAFYSHALTIDANCAEAKAALDQLKAS
jgi:Flp pilus assembly protein TadD